MCKFCKSLKEWKDIEDENVDIEYRYKASLVRIVCRKKQRKSIYRECPCELNYCPICGRKLVEE